MPSNHRLPSFWLMSLAGWVLIGVFLFFIRWVFHHDPWRAAGITLIQEFCAILLAGFLLVIYRRMPPNQRFSVKISAQVLGLCCLVAVMQALVTAEIMTWMGWHHRYWTLLEAILLRFVMYWMVFIGWSLLYFWLQAERGINREESRAETAQAEAQRLELQLLRAQLDPHFLFNALNGIATVITSDPAKALAMVRSLADYLRYLLDQRHDSIICLSAEAEAMHNYLLVEKARFGTRLETSITIEPTAGKCRVPCFLLQPLIENAVKHSFAHVEPPWKLRVEAQILGDSLRLVVRNTGHWQPDQRGHGIGLENLRRRLVLYYPERHRLAFTEQNGMVVAELELEGKPWSE